MDNVQVYLLTVFLFAMPVSIIATLTTAERDLWKLGAILTGILPGAAYLIPTLSTPVNLGPFVLDSISTTIFPGSVTLALIAYAQLEPERARWYPWCSGLGYVVFGVIIYEGRTNWDAPGVWSRYVLMLLAPAVMVGVGWLIYDAVARRYAAHGGSAIPLFVAVPAVILVDWSTWFLLQTASMGVGAPVRLGGLLSALFGALFFTVPLSSLGRSDDHNPGDPRELARVLAFADTSVISWIAGGLRSAWQRATAPDVDPETGLLASSELESQLRRGLETARTHTGELTLISARVEGLERVDRQLGADIASTVVNSAAEAFMRATRASASAVRRDNTFIAIFPNMRAEHLSSVPEEIEDFSFEHPQLTEAATMIPSVIRYPEDATTRDGLVDAAMT